MAGEAWLSEQDRFTSQCRAVQVAGRAGGRSKPVGERATLPIDNSSTRLIKEHAQDNNALPGG